MSIAPDAERRNTTTGSAQEEGPIHERSEEWREAEREMPTEDTAGMSAATTAFDRDNRAEHIRRPDPLAARQRIAAHEGGAVTRRAHPVDAERARPALVADEIAGTEIAPRARIDVDDVAVAQERQHAGAADADPQRLAAAQQLDGERRRRARQSFVDGTRAKVLRATGEPTPSTYSSRHHSPYSPYWVIRVPPTGTEVSMMSSSTSAAKA